MYLRYKLIKKGTNLYIKFTKVSPSFDKYRGTYSESFKDINVIVSSVKRPALSYDRLVIRIYLPGIALADDGNADYYAVVGEKDCLDVAQRIHTAMKRCGAKWRLERE